MFYCSMLFETFVCPHVYSALAAITNPAVNRVIALISLTNDPALYSLSFQQPLQKKRKHCYRRIPELSILYYTFFYKKPVYKKSVLNFFSELRNRVLMFQVHKKLARHFSKKRRVFVQNDANRAKIRNREETEYSKR